MAQTKPTTKQITYTSPSSPTVTRNLIDKLFETVSILDFGAVGDGVTDNTTAFTNAITWMIANSKPVYVPPGTYLTGPQVIHSASNHTYGGFYGADPRNTFIKDKTTSTGFLFTVGSSGMSTYEGYMRFANITFQANGNAVGSGAFRAYDLAWTSFENCNFQAGETAFDCAGGVNVTFYNCQFQYAKYGLFVRQFTRVGGGWPNNIKVIGGGAGSNTVWGIYFNSGRQLILEGCQIEGNGTSLGAWSGGLCVDINVGDETGVAGSNAQIGVIARGCWFESNYGQGDVLQSDGICKYEDCLFWSANTWVTNNIRIMGGKYSIDGCDANHTFTAGTPNVYEAPAVWSGNHIFGSEFPYITYDPAKTTVSTGTSFNAPSLTVNGAFSLASPAAEFSLRSGNVATTFNSAASTNITKPLHMIGFDGSGTSGTVTINFNKTMANTGTVIMLAPVGVPATNVMYSPIVTGVTTTGFSVRKDQVSGGSVTQGNYNFYWTAVGEGT